MEFLKYVKFMKLPLAVRHEVMETLKVFDEVSVIFEYGEYHVNTTTYICKEYAPDKKFIDIYSSEELYTKYQRAVNFYTEFGYSRYGQGCKKVDVDFIGDRRTTRLATMKAKLDNSVDDNGRVGRIKSEIIARDCLHEGMSYQGKIDSLTGEHGITPKGVLCALERMEMLRAKVKANPDNYPLDNLCRMFEAELAHWAGFDSRSDWTKQLKDELGYYPED